MGERILPFRLAGEENFWLDMIHGFRAAGQEVETLSMDVDNVPSDDLRTRGVRQIPIYFRHDARFNEGYGRVAGTNSYVSKTVTLSGFRARSDEEAFERLLEIEADRELQRHLGEGARRVALERCPIDRAIRE